MTIDKNTFEAMTVADQGMALLTEGKHITQFIKEDQLLNLYSLSDFFVEVYYSLKTNQIDKIEVVTDLSRIDIYIDESRKEEQANMN